ncbi:hypothetical protein WICPIJ_001721 [Wickerhamomyces pijperi]|uniref:PQ-loop-domain-containing protein n=1 Tax=Wickerhamomyces pijperi TaxID=599730 RepID=A0A9P8QB34_WICPI|nr:hypothetical protein WICPIJ_001721 [Wickerhamomyces pijperi]
MSDLCDKDSLTNLISTVSGVLSFGTWLICQLPQCYEIYQTKSVEGISPLFIGLWIVGDVSNLIGCILTNQLFFQYVIAAYFLFCDLILISQFFYYGYYLKKRAQSHHHHQHHHHHTHNPSRNNSSTSLSNNAALAASTIVIASNMASASALPLTMGSDTPIITLDTGVVISWIASACYFFARVPQLFKNYERKSTEDISPFLFGCTLVGNLTYTVSILFNCQFLYGDNKLTFFMNELPFIIGSGGTIVFDIIFFYQVWLYKEESSTSSPKNNTTTSTEETPLLNSQ